MSNLSDLELLGALGHEIEPEKPKSYSPLEARLIAGFEDILKFVEEHGHPPQHGENRDIFERLYAVRLDQLRKNPEAVALLASMDSHALLQEAEDLEVTEPDDDALLGALGVDPFIQDKDDITKIKHVAPMAHRQAAEEIANREVCRDFHEFEPIFTQLSADLKTGLRETRDGIKFDDINVGALFILNGQIAYIAEKGELKKAPNEDWDARLRIIYDNGTESNMLLRSVLRRANDDTTARTVTTSDAGPLFSDAAETENESGTIYVLRSLSELPEILPFLDVILKIGVTGGNVKRRVANAKNEATYLLGDVEIVDEYKLYNINRIKLERMLQSVFAQARLSIEIKDRFGNPVNPNEWFIVTREAVAQAVSLIKSGEIKNYVYDVKEAVFVKVEQD